MDKHSLARLIDHTLLRPDATHEEIILLCKEAYEYGFVSVCVNPCWVKEAVEELAGKNVKVCTVIGFPLGAAMTKCKVYETEQAILFGASEVDMVMNIGALKSGEFELVKEDIRAVVEAGNDKLVKVILETCLLSESEIIQACQLAQAAGAHFVKTSTGFSTGGAQEKIVQLMHNTIGAEMGVKASGGIRDHQSAVQMVQAGASRLGTSNGISIVEKEVGVKEY